MEQIDSNHSIRRVALCLLLLLSSAVGGAEEELTVLTITGDLIAKIESSAATPTPEELIARYYALLDELSRERAQTAAAELASLFVDFEVAFTAADTAEVNNVMSDIGHLWAVLRTLHAREFSPDAVAELRAAYGDLYPPLSADD